MEYSELRKLNSIHRKDYTRVILKEDSHIREYVKKVGKDTNLKHDGLSKLIWDIEDVADTWEEAVTLINEAVARKAKEARIEQGRFESKMDEDLDILSEDDQIGCISCNKDQNVRNIL